ncbi:MAG TPA: ABC transporter permease [Caproiciproducens sp.]|nr:ABC transporter permease [Caproiciproducens sp.]
MFAHIFTARLKCLVRDRQTVFWTLFFPLILATFFYMAFSNLNSSQAFRPIDIAVVNDAGYQQNEGFRAVLDDVSKGDDRIFNLTVTEKGKADRLLNEGKIKGYITVGPQIGMTVNDSGFGQTVIKSFLDSYQRTYSTAKTVIRLNPNSVRTGLLKDLTEDRTFTKEVSASSAKPDEVLIYFYSLIAMSCMYAGFSGLKEVMDIQANLTQRAARVNIAPVHKLKLFLYNLCAALLVQYTELLVLIAYLHFVLRIDLSAKIGFVLLTTFIGSIVGLTFGAFISALIPKGEGVKVGVLISVSMLGSFLSGMMYSDIKYIIAKKAPVLAYLNPINLLTDAFYSLYYYDTYTRYAVNMGILGIFILFFSLSTYLIIRRQKYASL